MLQGKGLGLIKHNYSTQSVLRGIPSLLYELKYCDAGIEGKDALTSLFNCLLCKKANLFKGM